MHRYELEWTFLHKLYKGNLRCHFIVQYILFYSVKCDCNLDDSIRVTKLLLIEFYLKFSVP